VAAVRRLVAQLAVALARDLVLVHHQIDGDEAFADALSHFSCRVHLAVGGIVVTKTPAKLILGLAALAAGTSFGTSTSQAFGDAPWCAVINIGTGTAYWDCQYSTFEACYPDVLAGNRGFCNVNPWPGPSQAVPYKYRYQKRYAR
jgi:hypothetical protein